MTRHDWLTVSSWTEAAKEQRDCSDDTGLDRPAASLVIEKCASCGSRRALVLGVGRTGDRWRTVAVVHDDGDGRWRRGSVVGACPGRDA